MGRPSKATVDYFSHDCRHTRTMEIIEGRFPEHGYKVFFKLLETLGSSEGHMVDFSDEIRFEHFSGVNCRISAVETIQILDFLARIQAIDCELWEYDKVIWCQHFVDRLADVYAKRKCSLPGKPSLRNDKPVDSPDTIIKDTFPGQESTKESKGKETIVNPPLSRGKKTQRPKTKTHIPDDITLTSAMIAYATERNLNPQSEFEAFCDYHRGKQSLWIDWPGAAWRTWCRNAVKFGSTSRPNTGNPGTQSNEGPHYRPLSNTYGDADPLPPIKTPTKRERAPIPPPMQDMPALDPVDIEERKNKLRQQAQEILKNV